MAEEGSYGGGFAVGFLLGLIGLIICIEIDKPQTRRGAAHGFIVRIVSAVIITAFSICAVFALSKSF